MGICEGTSQSVRVINYGVGKCQSMAMCRGTSKDMSEGVIQGMSKGASEGKTKALA